MTIYDIKERLRTDPDWGVYDGVLSRSDLTFIVAAFELLEIKHKDAVNDYGTSVEVLADRTQERDVLQADNKRLRDELSALRGKIERGEMVAVVKCKDCVHGRINPYTKKRICDHMINSNVVSDDGFCEHGKRAEIKEG